MEQEQKIEITPEDEVKALREELASLKKEKEEKELNESLNRKIDDLVAQKLKERDDSERQRIEKARLIMEEAERNNQLEQELLKNEKYNRISNWKENKLEELKREIDNLARMGRESRHPADLYLEYDKCRMKAAAGDTLAKRKLGYIELIYAAMKLGGEKLTDILRRNIGEIE